jgi:hypothetical protein
MLGERNRRQFVDQLVEAYSPGLRQAAQAGVLGLRNSNRQHTQFERHQSRVQDAMAAESKAPRSARWPQA